MAEQMSRRKIREEIFKLIYQAEFCDRDETEERVNSYLEQIPPMTEEDKKTILEKVESIRLNEEKLDEMISRYAKGWKINRMNKVDLAILRLAVYEIKMDESIPTGVAINEAVELAKLFGGDESPRFINGILSSVAGENE